jgi:hypothetical protein
LAPIDTGKERYRCPGCGSQVRTTFHDNLANKADSWASVDPTGRRRAARFGSCDKPA